MSCGCYLCKFVSYVFLTPLAQSYRPPGDTQVNETSGLVLLTLIHCCHMDTTSWSTSHYIVRFKSFSHSVETEIPSLRRCTHKFTKAHNTNWCRLLTYPFVAVQPGNIYAHTSQWCLS